MSIPCSEIFTRSYPVNFVFIYLLLSTQALISILLDNLLCSQAQLQPKWVLSSGYLNIPLFPSFFCLSKYHLPSRLPKPCLPHEAFPFCSCLLDLL